MRWFSVLIVTCCVAMTTVYGMGKGFQMAVGESLQAAYANHLNKMQFNQQLMFSGVDGSNTDQGHANMHSMLRPVANATSENMYVAQTLIEATQILSKKLQMTLPEMLSNQELVSTWQAMVKPYCMQRWVKCPPVPFRSADGSCNNLLHPTWGMAFRPQQRWIPSAYEDGINVPTVASVTGKALPSARVVSNMVHNSGKTLIPSHRFTNWMVSFGQQIAHDVVETPTLKGANGASITCCGLDPKTLMKRPECFVIQIPPHDHRFPYPCMNFVRSAPATEDSCGFGPRNQVNQISSYLDANFLYGADIQASASLRAFKFGMLKETENGLFFPEPPAPGRCTRNLPKDYCMHSGDPRGHHVPILIASHVLFLREHNRIAHILAHLNPHWNDERIYQEARKIVIGMYQHILFLEYLPKVIGPQNMVQMGLLPTSKGHNTVYNPKVDATLFNSFGVASFRFGHSQISSTISLLSLDHSSMQVPIEHTFNTPTLAVMKHGQGAEDLVRGLRSPAYRSDRFVDKGVRDFLFLDKNGNSFDLAAFNIQRGRDHGTPSYSAFRRWCGLKPPVHFGPGPGGLIDIDPETVMLLAKTYKHVEDIDLFTGGLSEVPVKGGSVGPLFACLIGRQFADLKFGDRFYYENAYPHIGFTQPQLNEIKRIRFSTIVCNNMKQVTTPVDVFLIPSEINPELPCHSFPPIDLGFWKEMIPGPFPKGIHPPMLPNMKLYRRK